MVFCDIFTTQFQLWDNFRKYKTFGDHIFLLDFATEPKKKIIVRYLTFNPSWKWWQIEEKEMRILNDTRKPFVMKNQVTKPKSHEVQEILMSI